MPQAGHPKERSPRYAVLGSWFLAHSNGFSYEQKANHRSPRSETKNVLSPETLESYRQMTPGQRLRLALDLSDSAWSAAIAGPPEIVAKRFEKLRQQNDLRNQRICAALIRSKRLSESDSRSEADSN